MIEAIEVIKFLADEVEQELYRRKVYKQCVEVARDEAVKKYDEQSNDKDKKSWHYFYKQPLIFPEPSKAMIHDNLKQIRRLCLKIDKQLHSSDT